MWGSSQAVAEQLFLMLEFDSMPGCAPLSLMHLKHCANKKECRQEFIVVEKRATEKAMSRGFNFVGFFFRSLVVWLGLVLVWFNVVVFLLVFAFCFVSASVFVLSLNLFLHCQNVKCWILQLLGKDEKPWLRSFCVYRIITLCFLCIPFW